MFTRNGEKKKKEKGIKEKEGTKSRLVFFFPRGQRWENESKKIIQLHIMRR